MIKCSDFFSQTVYFREREMLKLFERYKCFPVKTERVVAETSMSSMRR